MPKNQSGFAHLLVLVTILGVVVLALISNLPVTSKFSDKGIQGVFLAKEGDEGGSSRDSHDSKSSSGSSDSGSSTPKPATVKTSPSHSSTKVEEEGVEIKTVEREQGSSLTEIKLGKKQEREFEDEIENELEREEVEKVEFKNINGEIEFEAKDATGSAQHKGKHKGKKVKLNLKVKNATEEAELEIEGSKLKLKVKNEQALSRFPLSLDNQGNLFVNTPNGLKQIRILPDQASQIAQEAGVQNQIEGIELNEENDTKTEDDLVFKLKGKKMGTILGLIPFETEVESEIGAQTGQVLAVTEPLWLRLLTALVR